MDHVKKYNSIFIEVFDVEVTELNNDFTIDYKSNWDSIRHLSLIAALEDEFDMMLDTDDILEFNSYEKGKHLLAKYGIEL
ncbi:MAG: acyl carrier protein [Firmicutes bacterium HGW-Firmicutes-1]|jgi:acyl carrier protein|nr:MAG: acyl carrier protein [Firmicutes bacterium HGW-Firmicutes-1]